MEGSSDSIGSNIASSSTLYPTLSSAQSKYDKTLAQLNALKLPSDPYQNYRNKDCLEHQARLLQAFNAGYPFLAQKILEIDHKMSVNMAKYSSPLLSNFNQSEELGKALETVLDCLMTIQNAKGNSLLRAMLEGNLGRYIYEAGQLPALPKLDQFGMNSDVQMNDTYQPVVFVSIHCNNKGEAPSKAEYLVVLERMKTYLNTFGGEGQQGSDEYAQEIDFAGFISYPAIPTAADYASGSVSEHNWMIEPHGRRYANTTEKVRALTDFISALEARLNTIPDHDLDSRIPWHLTHVGWSPQYGKQSEEHTKYDVNHIKILVETITSREFQLENYSMHTHPIINLASASDVSAAHIISILTASYACHGGLNHTAVGTGADISYAQQLPAECWKVGVLSLAQDGFMVPNMVKCNLQTQLGHEIAKMSEKQGKIDDLRAEIAAIEEGHENGMAIEEKIVTTFISEFGRKAVDYLRPTARQSTLRITHPELLATTEGNTVRRLSNAPFLVMDEESTDLDVDLADYDMEEEEEDDEEMDESI